MLSQWVVLAGPVVEGLAQAWVLVVHSEDVNALSRELELRLTGPEVSAVRARTDLLLEHRIHPYPAPDWPAVPWPPV